MLYFRQSIWYLFSFFFTLFSMSSSLNGFCSECVWINRRELGIKCVCISIIDYLSANSNDRHWINMNCKNEWIVYFRHLFFRQRVFGGWNWLLYVILSLLFDDTHTIQQHIPIDEGTKIYWHCSERGDWDSSSFTKTNYCDCIWLFRNYREKRRKLLMIYWMSTKLQHFSYILHTFFVVSV